MFQKFYGLTALNLLMVGMPIKLYVECIDNLKNDKETLVLLREQFNSIGNFLDSIPSEYKDREAKRAFGKLNRLLKTAQYYHPLPHRRYWFRALFLHLLPVYRAA